MHASVAPAITGRAQTWSTDMQVWTGWCRGAGLRWPRRHPHLLSRRLTRPFTWFFAHRGAASAGEAVRAHGWGACCMGIWATRGNLVSCCGAPAALLNNLLLVLKHCRWLPCSFPRVQTEFVLGAHCRTQLESTGSSSPAARHLFHWVSTRGCRTSGRGIAACWPIA